MTTTSVNWEELLQQVQELPTLPSVAAQILPTVDESDMSLQTLEGLILHDPALTAKVMRLANSTLFGAAGRITTMSHALFRMDIHAAKLIALSFHLDNAVGQPGRFDYPAFWRKSSATSVLATHLARRFPEVNIDEARVAGLLAGVGQLFLAEALGPQYAELCHHAERSATCVAQAERRALGVDHSTVAGMVLSHWHFPASLVNAIQSHLQPKTIDQLPEHTRELAKVLHLASLLADHALLRHSENLGIAGALAEMWAKIDPAALETLLVDVRHELDQTRELFEETDQDCDELLGQAKKLMIQVSLVTAENLTITARQAEENQQKIEDLRRETSRLAQQVTTDPLTGIGNRKFFDLRLQEETKRARRTGSQLSLILFDLDHFKRLNDTFGHQAGDMVLRSATKAVCKVLRTTDVVARYGGEEFAVIAPGTDLAGAIASAERMRQCLESVAVLYNGRKLRISASFGVAAVENPEHLRSVEQLVEVADACLYEAKHAGRNCVRSTSL